MTVARSLPKVLRVHQWLKNLLVFAPLVASLSVSDPARVIRSVVAFVLFSLCASSVYIFNDLIDVRADQAHPRKRARPFASGDVSVAAGVVLAMLLATGAFGAAFTFMPLRFSMALGAYVLTSAAYSLFLKTVVIADVVMLAALYSVRIVAGAFAIDLAPSFWLLAFSMFLFLSLALIKRCTEIRELASEDGTPLAGRGYIAADLPLLRSIGVAAGLGAVLVLALYINSQEVLLQYSAPSVLWILCPLLMYWLGRMWLYTERGLMHDDPVVFASRDRATLLAGVMSAVVIALAAR